MKKTFYIASFTLLGFLLQLLLHAGVEIWYIELLIRDFEIFSLGLSWDAWFLIHHIGAVVLFLGGIAFGLWQGRYWWQKLYERTPVGKHRNVKSVAVKPDSHKRT